MPHAGSQGTTLAPILSPLAFILDPVSPVTLPPPAFALECKAGVNTIFDFTFQLSGVLFGNLGAILGSSYSFWGQLLAYISFVLFAAAISLWKGMGRGRMLIRSCRIVQKCIQLFDVLKNMLQDFRGRASAESPVVRNSSAAAAVAAVAVVAVATPKVGVFWKAVSSRLGLRTEISARYYREATRTGVPHFFCVHENTIHL